jgi:hypothetical protein
MLKTLVSAIVVLIESEGYACDFFIINHNTPLTFVLTCGPSLPSQSHAGDRVVLPRTCGG